MPPGRLLSSQSVVEDVSVTNIVKRKLDPCLDNRALYVVFSPSIQ